MTAPNWQQPEQLEAYIPETGQVFPVVPDMMYWSDDDDGTYRAKIGGRWWWFNKDGTALYRDIPYRIRNRAETAETVRAEFDAYKREVSEAVKDALGGFVTCSSEYLSRRDVSNYLSRFILPEPPAVDAVANAIKLVLDDVGYTEDMLGAKTRAALASLKETLDAAGEEQRSALKVGDRVEKIKGSCWTGRVVGFYRTELTPYGVCVESEREPGSVQIYPEAALRIMWSDEQSRAETPNAD